MSELLGGSPSTLVFFFLSIGVLSCASERSSPVDPPLQSGAELFEHEPLPLEMALKAFRVSDDDGARPAAIRPGEVARWVRFANEVYAPAGIRFLYDESVDIVDIHDTTLNNATSGDEANWPEVKRKGNEIARRVHPQVPLLFRHGAQEQPTGQSWSGGDYDFVIMSGFEPSLVCGVQNIGLLAHELGHFLSLDHTFAAEYPSIEEVQERFRTDGLAIFDGDGIADTPPDPFVRQDEAQCAALHAIYLGDEMVQLPRDNIMSYWYWPTKTLSPTQQSRVRAAAELRNARPVNRPGPFAVELEDAEPAGRADCSFYLQPMEWWGAERWSAGVQRLCEAEAGDSFSLNFEVAETGEYELVLYATRAPDYGRYEVSVDGETIEGGFDGYAPLVVPTGPLPLGRRKLRAGRHRIRFQVTGFNPISSGTLIGVDSLELILSEEPRQR